MRGILLKGADMKSPFPGMDPFIESQGLWGDFHDNFIIDVQRAIQRQLPPQYLARVNDRSYVDSIDPELDVVRHSFGPDIEVQRFTPPLPAPRTTPGVALADPPTTEMRGQVDIDFRETFLDIFKLNPNQQLVTSIELLSPANKRRGGVGWELYQRKRQIFINGHANLVEIDLLRGGRRHSMIGRWPDSPYAVAVYYKQNAPRCAVWAAFTTRPLPNIAIPLDPPDADVVVVMQPIVETIYELSRYGVQIRYDRTIEPPLTEDEMKIARAAKRPE